MNLNRQNLPESQIRHAIQQHKAVPLPEIKADYRKASVLIPLLYEDEWKLFFIRRAETVRDHKGQVAFPGGAQEAIDRSPEETALREAFEEVGLPYQNVEVLGKMDDLQTNSDFIVSPIIGLIDWPFEVIPQIEEVSRTFTIPLGWLAEPTHRESRMIKTANGTPHEVVFFKTFDQETLWGISALLTVRLLTILGLN